MPLRRQRGTGRPRTIGSEGRRLSRIRGFHQSPKSRHATLTEELVDISTGSEFLNQEENL